MLPLGIFASRTFSAANVMTLLVYAALGAVLFFLVLQLQTVAGYSPLAAGVATLPITVCMLFLAARGGRLAVRIGPRIPMTLGPVVMAAGVLWLLTVDATTTYWTTVLPGLTLFGLGLALMVAPLTATVLAAAPVYQAGLASGVNNAVARPASLLAVAALPPLVGLTGEEYADALAFDAAYSAAMLVCAGLLAVGGVISWLPSPPGYADGMRRGWPATAAAATLLLVLTACSEAPTTGREPDPSGSASPSPSEGTSPTKGGSTLPVADPEHAVEPPGPLEDRLYRPDMLIFDREPLSDDMIKRIRALPEVAAAEVIGLGNVAIENQLLTVAAVDGATFRRFTPAGSAQTQDVWDRLAGGELAIDPRLGRKLQDEDGNLALGSGDDAPVVHIGAYAPQPETIDMVVNEAWVEDIGRMVLGNGLIISTDEDDPSTIRKRVQAIVGDTASVQDLDIASRLGLDPTASRPPSSPAAPSRTRSAPSTTRCSAAAGSPPTRRGWRPTSPPRPCRSSAPSPATARSSRSCALPSRRSSPRAWPTRSTPASTPAATTRASSPAPPRSPTTPSAWRSTSTCRATSAAPSARWTAAWWRSSSGGASPGAATGATPTRCTSR